jgi:hypothetical protein
MSQWPSAAGRHSYGDRPIANYSHHAIAAVSLTKQRSIPTKRQSATAPTARRCRARRFAPSCSPAWVRSSSDQANSRFTSRPERAVRSDRRRSAPNAERRSIQPPLRMIPKTTPSASAPSDNAINWCQGHISGFDQLSTGLRRSHPFRRSRSSPHSTELVLCKSVRGT